MFTRALHFIKNNRIHFFSILVFLLISLVYFSPALSGYVIDQHDVKTWAGASQELADYRNMEGGKQMQWTNSMFSGMPSVQISMTYPGLTVVFTILDVLTLWLPSPINFLFLYFISFYILALSLRIKPMVSLVGSVAFGLSSYFLIILQAGHNTKALAIGIAPLVIAGFIMSYRRKKMLVPIVLSGLFMALELRANHLQVTYYLGILLIGLGIMEFISAFRKKKISSFLLRTAGLLSMYLLALGVNYGNIQGTLDYSKQSTRNGSELTILPDGSSKSYNQTANKGLDIDYITRWSYGIGETFTFIVPNFKGGASLPISRNQSNEAILLDVNSRYRNNIAQSSQYWGEQPITSGPVYLGIIVVFLAILAFFYVKDQIKWPLLIVSLLTIALGWGKNFLPLTEFFVDYIPGYSKFRAVTIILSIVELIIPILAILFLNKLVSDREKIITNLKPFFGVLVILLVLLVSFMVAPTLFNNFITSQEYAQLSQLEGTDNYAFVVDLFDELEAVRIAILQKDVLRSILFLVLGAGAIFVSFKNEVFLKKGVVPVLGVLILIDLVGVDLRYLNTDTKGADAHWVEGWKQKYPYVANAADKMIFKQETDAADLSKLIDGEVSKLASELRSEKIRGAQARRAIEHLEYRVLGRNSHFRVYDQNNPFNSSRASYFHKSLGGYHGAKLARYQDLIEFQLSKNNQEVINMLNAKYVVSPDGKVASPNTNALGNAWFVKSVKTYNSLNELIKGLDVRNTYQVQAFNGNMVSENSQTGDSLVEVTGANSLFLLTPDGAIPLPEIPFQASIQKDIALYSVDGTQQWDYFKGMESEDLLLVIRNNQSGFDPKNEAIMLPATKEKLTSSTFSGEGVIALSSYTPDKMIYTSSSRENQLAVFSEIYLSEGWKATVDNKPAEILPVNYLLRGLEIPSGEHTIEFEYIANSYALSNYISLSISILILFLLFGAFYYEYLRKDNVIAE